jgi:hypothetical protein
MQERETELQKIITQWVKYFKEASRFIIAPFIDPLSMIIPRSLQRDRSILLSLIGLLLAITVSPVRIIWGGILILCNLLWGVFALPRAMRVDYQRSDPYSGISLYDAAEDFVEEMSGMGSLFEQPNTTPTTSSLPEKENSSPYSVHTTAYLKDIAKKPSFEEKINNLIEFLKENNDELTDADLNDLERFKDPIMLYPYMKTPVCLNEVYYDLDSLLKLPIINPTDRERLDPMKRANFKLSEIQSARNLINEFEEVLKNIKNRHITLEPEIDSQVTFSM